jgi:HAMP domain-containing protein
MPAQECATTLARGRALRLLNFLIIASLVVAAAAGGLAVATVGGAQPTITIEAAVSDFANGTVQIHVPVEIHNDGFLAIRNVAVSVAISDNSNHRLLAGTSGNFDVPPKSIAHQNVTLAPNLGSVPVAEMRSLLIQDQTLKPSAAGASIPNLIGVSGTVNGSLPWGAMMENMAFSRGVVTPYNSTWSQVSFPYTFRNDNQYFRLLANGTGVVKDQAGNVVGFAPLFGLEVRRGTAFNGAMTTLVKNSALQGAGGQTFEVDIALQGPIYSFLSEIQVVVHV